MILRVWFKLLLSKIFFIPSFCKRCGRWVHDYLFPDRIWNALVPEKYKKRVLCYDCFCIVTNTTAWEIKVVEGKNYFKLKRAWPNDD
jgi:hypothetical protein